MARDLEAIDLTTIHRHATNKGIAVEEKAMGMMVMKYATKLSAGLAILGGNTQINLQMNREGCGRSETTDENLLSRRIHWYEDPVHIFNF